MKITVTQEDINNPFYNDPIKSAIARAFDDEWDISKIIVGNHAIHYKCKTYLLTTEAVGCINDYDNGAIYPFEFEIE